MHNELLKRLLPLRPGGFDAFIYSCKAAISAVVSFYVFGLFGIAGASWAALSAVIVTQPTLHPSVRASVFRLLANVIGAFVGATLTTVIGGGVWPLAIGVLLTGLACHFFHLDEGLRAAYAAVVIVMMIQGSNVWFGSLDRVLAVTVGCVCALFVSVIFHFTFSGIKAASNDESHE